MLQCCLQENIRFDCKSGFNAPKAVRNGDDFFLANEFESFELMLYINVSLSKAI